MKKKLLALILAALMLTTVLSSCGTALHDLFYGEKDVPETPTLDDAGSFFRILSKKLTDEGFLKGFRASDLITLPKYKGAEAPVSVYEPDPLEVKYQLENGVLAYYYVEYRTLDPRPIENGDSVNIDYVGYVDGEAFSGGSTQGEGTVVTIGVTSYIDGFLPQLIGHMPGESFDINVTFPENYGAAELAGKDAVFSITVNALVEPIITDEMAQEIDPSFKTAEDLMKDIEAWVLDNSRYEFVRELVNQSELKTIPDDVREFFIDYYMYLYIVSNGTDVTPYRTEFAEVYAEAIDFNMKFCLFGLAVAEKEGIRVTAEDLTASGYEDDLEAYGQPFIYFHIISHNLVQDYVVKNAVRAAE